MAVHAPNPGLYCAQRLLHSSIALNGRRGSPPLGQNHSSDGGGRHWRFVLHAHNLIAAVPYDERRPTIRNTDNGRPRSDFAP